MLKPHRKVAGILYATLTPTLVFSCLLLLLLCFCTLHSFVIFHIQVLSSSPGNEINSNGNSARTGFVNDASPKVLRNRGPVMYAISEETPVNGFSLEPGDLQGQILEKRKRQVEVKASKPSLDKPPMNASEEERIEWFRHNLPAFKILHSDSLSAQFPAKAKAFFKGCKPRFFMTWISQTKSFGPREMLSVESVFKWHPSACLLVVSRAMDSEKGREIFRPLVSQGFRVMAAAPDLGYLFKGTPAEAWLKDVQGGNTDPGEISFNQNLSNILRLAALYKYGGIYLDSDMLLLKRLSKLRNVIGAQNVDPESGAWNRLNNAVLVFDKGHPLLFKFIQEFALTFNGNKWGHNGPYLVTRVVRRVANRSGYEFRVLPPLAFYPVDWTRIRSYFKRPANGDGVKWMGAKLLQMEKQTYAVHLWNKQSRQLDVEEGSIIHRIFNECCIFCHHN